MYNVTNYFSIYSHPIWIELHEVATWISLSWIHCAMEDDMIFGHPVGNQVIWVGLNIKWRIKNVLKLGQLLVMKGFMQDTPKKSLCTRRNEKESFYSDIFNRLWEIQINGLPCLMLSESNNRPYSKRNMMYYSWKLHTLRQHLILSMNSSIFRIFLI